MSDDGQPDEMKEWEDYEGPQEIPDAYSEYTDPWNVAREEYKKRRLAVKAVTKMDKQIIEFGKDIPAYKEWLTTLEHEELNTLRDELLNYVRMINNERRRRKGYGDDCLCKEKKK